MSDENIQSGTYSSPRQIGTSPAAEVKRWLLELSLAEKSQKDWLRTSEKTYEKYRGTKQKKNSFNILWSNTETLRQAIYNTLPKPDVRRRYRDEDPVGKIVSDVLERCSEYVMDVYDFDHVLKLDLLDMLLTGRGLSRVKYVPDIEELELDTSQDDESNEEPEVEAQIKYEMTMCEHVSYKAFRHGPGETWDDVRWVAFLHRFSQSTLVDKFGDIGYDIPLEDTQDEEIKKTDRMVGDLFKTAPVWEIWDKDTKKTFFICPAYKAAPLYPLDNPEGDDPLGLDGFFPIPRPLYAIEDAESLLPTTLYEEYRQQAEELDRISTRINNLIEALRVRGAYNAVMAEIKDLQDASDNQLIPITNSAALVESGGLEKHIFYMPIEQAANVIQILVQQREACKSVIYEITGIADIMRGATDAQETLGAQRIKTQWGTQRLRKMQSEFQRYVRDIIRLKCQIIANKFQPQTLVEMTGIKLIPTEAEKQSIQQQAQAAQQYQQAMQSGQAPQMMQAPQMPPPDVLELLQKPSWEQVMMLLKDKVHRNYRIDIETDSTIAGSLESDMQGLQQVLGGVTQFIAGIGPAVQAGAMPIEAVKEIVMAITRRARLGMAVEDALDKMQAPQPQQDPNAGRLQAQMQIEQMKAESDAKAKQMDLALEQQRMQMEARIEEQRAQNEMRIAQAEQAYQAQQNTQAQQLEHQRELQRQAHEKELEQMRIMMDQRMSELDNQIQLLIADKNNAAKIEVAEIQASTTLQNAQISAAQTAEHNSFNNEGRINE